MGKSSVPLSPIAVFIRPLPWDFEPGKICGTSLYPQMEKLRYREVANLQTLGSPNWS